MFLGACYDLSKLKPYSDEEELDSRDPTRDRSFAICGPDAVVDRSKQYHSTAQFFERGDEISQRVLCLRDSSRWK